MTDTSQEFVFRVLALGPSSGRFRRTNPSQPMPSPRANDALNACVDAIQATLASHGFRVVRSGSGVRGLCEVDPDLLIEPPREVEA